jgi:hypothetical protein
MKYVRNTFLLSGFHSNVGLVMGIGLFWSLLAFAVFTGGCFVGLISVFVRSSSVVIFTLDKNLLTTSWFSLLAIIASSRKILVNKFIVVINDRIIFIETE